MTRRAAISEGPFPFDPSELNLVEPLSTSIPKQEETGCWSICLLCIFHHADRLSRVTTTLEVFETYEYENSYQIDSLQLLQQWAVPPVDEPRCKYPSIQTLQREVSGAEALITEIVVMEWLSSKRHVPKPSTSRKEFDSLRY